MKKIIIGILVIIISISIFFLFKNSLSQEKIPENAVNIVSPLKNGSFRVTFVGKSYGVHQSEGEEYALDIVRITNMKDIIKGSGTYGTMVYSPCFGSIKEIHDGEPDERIFVKRKGAIANKVIIGCDGFDILMAHFKSGTFKVSKGSIVEIGDEIGQVGNSGYSDGPHLHIHGFVLSKDKENIVGIPIMFDGEYLTKGSIFRR